MKIILSRGVRFYHLVSPRAAGATRGALSLSRKHIFNIAKCRESILTLEQAGGF